MIAVQTEPFDPGALLTQFSAGRTDTGAVVSFSGLARGSNNGQAVSTLELDAFPGFTDQAIADLVEQARARFDIQDAMVVHRYGPIAPGEAIVFVACAAGHRRAAFEAADFLMDKLKTEAPFWKKETGPDGERWIEPRTGDYQDVARWSEPK